MRNKVREFRSIIYKYYDSETEFAKAINWPRQRLNRITNGVKVPSIEELDVMAEKLHTPIEELAQIFLLHKSTNGQQVKTPEQSSA